MMVIIANILSLLIEKFITDQKKKEEYRIAVLEALRKYDSSVLDSAKLRTEYDRIRKDVSQPPS